MLNLGSIDWFNIKKYIRRISTRKIEKKLSQIGRNFIFFIKLISLTYSKYKYRINNDVITNESYLSTIITNSCFVLYSSKSQIQNISFSSKLQCIPTGALRRHWVRGAKTFEQRRWRGKRLKRSKCNKCQILKIMIHFCSSTRQKCFRRYVVINVRWKNKMLDF